MQYAGNGRLSRLGKAKMDFAFSTLVILAVGAMYRTVWPWRRMANKEDRAKLKDW
jgi:hypothetical protein